MAVLYIIEQGAVLGNIGNRLAFYKDKKKLIEVQCHKIQSVLIFGNVQFTTQVARELHEHGIELAIMSS